VTPLRLADYLQARVAVPLGFSPGGATLLVQSNLKETMQLYSVSVAGGELQQLTDRPEPVAGEFLPDGRVLVSMDAGGNERLQLHLLDTGRPDELEPLVVDPDFIHRRGGATRDGRLLAYGCNRRNGVDFDVWVRDLETGDERMLFAPGGWCEPCGFSPDGRWLAVERPTERSGDNDLHLVDLDTGDDVLVARRGDDEAYFGPPAWLPESDAFLFATSSGRDTNGIARYDLASRTWEYVVESDWDLECAVDEAGRNLVVAVNAEGFSRVELCDPRTFERRSEVELPGRGVVGGIVLSRDGRRLAYHFSSALVAGDVWVHDLDSGERSRLTTSPSPVDPATLVEPELLRFPSFDGESIPALVYAPRGAAGPVPVVFTIHGGPESQSRPAWAGIAQYLVASGYAVAFPNVRGSTGYGKRFEHLDDVHRRLDSVRDLVALQDRLDEDGRFDTSRTVLYGGSYGGYMVLAGLAFHPERWAAGIDVVGISSLVTFLENTAPYRRYFREREYGSLERDREFLTAASPLTHVDRIVAPLFVIHGANDPRVPLGEAEQLHAALKEKGIPTELLVYWDEGHGLQKLPNRIEAYTRAVEFLERVLAPATAL
jgi:dipeptidyl aminopeptidase/acylaminoacyl peptidase